MKTKKIKFATILLGLVMALSLIPGFAIAENTGTDAQDNGTQGDLLPTTIGTAQLMQANDGKPSQVIQATSVIAFVGDQGKNLNAKVVEGNGSLSYAVKSGSENYVEVAADGALTLKAAPSDNIAYVTVTAAATDAYAETSVDVPVKIYETFVHTIHFQTVQYAANRVYDLNSLDIRLFDKNGNQVGSTTVENPRAGGNVTLSTTNFVDRTEMTAHIQISKKRDPFTLTGSSGVGGAINVYNGDRHSGKIFTCNYGMNAPDPEYTAPVAKTNLVANGQSQILIHPGSVSVGGNMEYNLGYEDKPNWNDGFGGPGYARATNPGTYYVWWRTHNTNRYSAQYIGQGRNELQPQRIVVTIAKGNINPTVNIEGWTYGEEPKTPTVTGNTGNGTVTYAYKVKGADNSTYSETVPTDAGEYTVRASIAESKTHNGGTATADFTIDKATLAEQNVRVVGYMGTNDQEQAWEGNFTKSLAGMVPDGAGVSAWTAGTPTYQVNGSAATWPEGFSFTTAPSVTSGGEFSATLQITKEAAAAITDVDQAGEFAVPVTVTSSNYDDATINVVMVPTARTIKKVTISDVPDSKTYDDDAFTLTATVEGGETGENNWYWYSSDPSVLEVASVQGSNTMSVTVVKPGSAQIMAWYEPTNGTTIGAAVTDPITVNKAAINPSATLEGWTYGGAPNTPSVSGNPGNGAVTYSYSGTTEGGTEFGPSAAPPTEAGTYTVTATMAETDNYLSGTSEPAHFTVEPKDITATVVAEDKVYDGTRVACVIATVNASDLIESDLDEGVQVENGKVTIPGLKGAFADASAGEGKTINLFYDEIVSPVANPYNYNVTLSQTPTATIAKRPVSVKADNMTGRYGEEIADLTYSFTDSTTLAEGDTVASLGITASTTATSGSDVGEYPITLTGGTANPNYVVTFGGDATYTITKAPSPVEVTSRITVKQGRQVDLNSYVRKGDETGAITYAISGDDYDCTIVDGVLDVPGSAVPQGANSASIKVNVAVAPDGNHEAPAETPTITVTITKRNVLTINAPDEISATYGDQGVQVSATVSGEGAEQYDRGITYTVEPGTDCVQMDDNLSGKLTINKAGTGLVCIQVGGDDDYEFVYKDVKVTINKAEITPVLNSGFTGWTYGGTAKVPTLTEGSNPGNGDVFFGYKAKGADDSTYTLTVPTQAGTYLVRAFVDETDNYLSGLSDPVEFTIEPKPITVTVSGADKTYDGTTDASVAAVVTASDLVEGDLVEDVPAKDGKVTIRGLKGSFIDPNAGDNKRIILDYDEIISPVANPENYDAYCNAPTASISPRPVSVKADDKSSQYGQAIATLTYGPYDDTSLAERDTVESLGIAASTTATSSSKVGEYPITLAGGTGNANYEVTLGEDATYTIAEADISKATVTLAQTSYTYDGKAKEPAVTSVALNGKTLEAGTDYDVSYENNVEAGTATATVTGKGNYAGEANATFAIGQPRYAMYRLYNPNSGEHFYTASKDERDYVVAAGWTDEGVGWTAPAKSDSPVYRLYNPNAGEHHYTLSADERDMLVAAGWNDEGTGWYSDDAKAVPIYREYNPNQFACNHNFTASEEEHAHLVSLGWRDEGIAWYGI